MPHISPYDIKLIKNDGSINVVKPDIFVICDTENVDEEGNYHGIPTLVIEILSKSTRRKDMVKKLDLYMQTGVKEYWIVDPDNKTVKVLDFSERTSDKYKKYKDNETLILEIKLENIFRLM